ncbi:MAG: hypothetical protein DMG26_11765 [Acidobacteria bacterium]|nr:MAG: hypothetical protein DMG26_11765 [Acidobacteriota bacterium]
MSRLNCKSAIASAAANKELRPGDSVRNSEFRIQNSLPALLVLSLALVVPACRRRERPLYAETMNDEL